METPEITLTIRLTPDQLDTIAGMVADKIRPEPVQPIEERYLSVKEVAFRTNQHIKTVYYHIKIGRLQAKNTGGKWLISHENFKNYGDTNR